LFSNLGVAPGVINAVPPILSSRPRSSKSEISGTVSLIPKSRAYISKPNHPETLEFAKDSYIVLMKGGISAEEFSKHRLWVVDIHASRLAKGLCHDTTGLKYIYDSDDFKGYSGSFDADTIKEIENNGLVMFYIINV